MIINNGPGWHMVLSGACRTGQGREGFAAAALSRLDLAGGMA